MSTVYNPIDSDQQLQSFLSAMANAFHNQGYEASESAELVGINMPNSFAMQAKERLSDPFRFAVETYTSSEKNVIAHLNAITVQFVSHFSNIIAGLWQTNSDSNTLEYVIALKEYNLQNRSFFNDFLEAYEQSGLDSRIPIVFHYIPQNLISGLKSVKEIKIEA